MNKLIYLLLFFPLSLWGCRGEKPKYNDFVGCWVGSNKDTIKINSDGTFNATHLQFKMFFRKDMLHKPNDTAIEFFDGNGKWNCELEEGFWKHQGWQFELEIDKISVQIEYVGIGKEMIVRGEKGFWENNPPWFLFFWEGEEGGDRYEFHKQK